MNVDLYAWLIIVLACMMANLPFMTQRFFFLFPWRRGEKSLVLRLGELLLGYAFVGGLAYLCEAHLGNVAAANWELYAITLCLFLVCAFPGFVWRYLYK